MISDGNSKTPFENQVSQWPSFLSSDEARKLAEGQRRALRLEFGKRHLGTAATELRGRGHEDEEGEQRQSTTNELAVTSSIVVENTVELH